MKILEYSFNYTKLKWTREAGGQKMLIYIYIECLRYYGNIGFFKKGVNKV